MQGMHYGSFAYRFQTNPFCVAIFNSITLIKKTIFNDAYQIYKERTHLLFFNKGGTN